MQQLKGVLIVSVVMSTIAMERRGTAIRYAKGTSALSVGEAQLTRCTKLVSTLCH